LEERRVLKAEESWGRRRNREEKKEENIQRQRGMEKERRKLGEGRVNPISLGSMIRRKEKQYHHTMQSSVF
jgi:hypothetical protein